MIAHLSRDNCKDNIFRPKCHWARKKGKWKIKRVYNTLEEAVAEINKYPNLYKRYNAYLCPICNKYHIGYYV